MGKFSEQLWGDSPERDQRGRYEEIKVDLAPVIGELGQVATSVDQAETALRSSRATAHLDRLLVEPRTPTLEHGTSIEL